MLKHVNLHYLDTNVTHYNVIWYHLTQNSLHICNIMFQCLCGKLCISRRLNIKLMENGIESGYKDIS